MEEAAVCKYFQTGYCKYGQQCYKGHIKELCPTQCNKSSCSKRHPRKCKYFSKTGYCKFNQGCAFAHETEGNNLKIEALENEIKVMKEEMKELKTRLMDKLEKLEKTIKSETGVNHHKQVEEEIIFKCDDCDYKANTKIRLNKHTNTKHMKKAVSETKVSDIQHVEKQEIEDWFKCDCCEDKCKTEVSLKKHRNTKHNDNTPCNACGVVCKTVDKLELHMLTVHDTDKKIAAAKNKKRTVKKEFDMEMLREFLD